jgi:dihydroorotate dehydrogenase (fumarate)
MTLTTTYLGLTLAHPIVCGASPLTADLNLVLRLEDAGAAAIVMHSLFEEQIVKGALRRSREGRDARMHAAAEPYTAIPPYARFGDEYLEHLLRVKARVGVPVLASLNGTTAEGWLHYARALEQAGADALELNFYNVASDPAESGVAIEQRLIDIVAVVTGSVRIPVSVKLLPFYSSIPNLADRLERIGARGVVLFNRLYLPDIDPDTGAALKDVRLSDPSDLVPRLHAIAALARFSGLSLALSGGVHEGIDVVKAVMAGADVVQVTSAILQHGPSQLTYLRGFFENWLNRHGCESAARLRKSAAVVRERRGPSADRADYLSLLQRWNPEHHNSH